MDQDQRFIPRSGISSLGEQVLEFLNRHLTIISIITALIAVALLIVGPIRMILFPSDASSASLAPLTGPEKDNAPLTGSSNTLLTTNLLTRQLVPFTIIPDRPRDKIIGYTVQPGDTVMGIAEKFGLTRETIFFSNEEALRGDVHMLQTGMTMNILPMDGALYKADGVMNLQQIADKYQADVNAIIGYKYNYLEGATPATTPNVLSLLVIPGGVGVMQADLWKPSVVAVTDKKTGATYNAFMPNMAGSCSASLQGSGGTGSWSSPLPGAQVSQPFWGGHTGIDLAMPIGTPAQAADTGVVIYSGWVPEDWGYGQLVVLDHGNGWTTYYAHLSAISVRCGQSVPRGGIVGAVGSTGRSSGAHLHFEMRWNHNPDNPAGYIGY